MHYWVDHRMTQPVTKKSLFQYGLIAMPIAFAGFPLYVLAPDFYTSHYGLSLSLIGFALLLIRLFDAVLDPVIGWLVDRMNGSFNILVISTSVILCIAIYGLFNHIYFTPILWFGICMALAVTSYSTLTIIVGTWATLWTNDKKDQTRIATARESFGLLGIIIAVSMPTLLQEVAGSHVYLIYSIILSVLMLCGIFGLLNILSRPLSYNSTVRISTSLISAISSLPSVTLRLYTAYCFCMLASSIPAVLVIFFVRDLLDAEKLMGAFLLLYFLSGAAAMPLWRHLSLRFGKYKSWMISNILAVSGFISAFLLSTGDVWGYGLVCVASGFSLGADLILPPSILSDQIHDTKMNNNTGIYYAMLVFVAKACLAVASVSSLSALDMFGFKPQSINSTSALYALSVAYALVPCLLKLLSAGLIYFFFVRHQTGADNETIQNNHSNGGTTHV